MIEIDELYWRRYSISEHLDSRGIQFQLSLWFWDLYFAYYCVHTSYSNFVFFSVHWSNLMSFFPFRIQTQSALILRPRHPSSVGRSQTTVMTVCCLMKWPMSRTTATSVTVSVLTWRADVLTRWRARRTKTQRERKGKSEQYWARTRASEQRNGNY